MRNIKLQFEYDGSKFWGYQRQREGRTVQGELERVLSRITDGMVTLNGAGRTDTGVHASGQVANFRTGSSLSLEKLIKGANSLLPSDIAITNVYDVADDFHARFSAISRRYEYSIHDNHLRTVFNRLYALHIPWPLNREAIIEACKHLIGEQDFSSFRAINDVSSHSFRNMISAGGETRGEVFVLFFEASSFLQHMIRIIVGTLLMVGRGKITADTFRQIIEAKNRAVAGPTAPPHGLCLTDVRYSG